MRSTDGILCLEVTWVQTDNCCSNIDEKYKSLIKKNPGKWANGRENTGFLRIFLV